MEFEKFCRQNKLTIFTISDLKILLNQYSREYLRLKLSRWKQKGYLNSPKRGLYMFMDAEFDEFEIASKLITPSYVSLETALSHYSIIPDVSAEVSGVTTKNTRTFKTNSSIYKFYHIKQALFSNFVHLREEIFIAEPQKAILDFFYFRKPDKDHLFFERINREIARGLNLKAMEKIANKFPAHTQKLFNHFKNVISR
ncbi:hypothetical protein HZA39_03020 [Candidatus Peregrinibacteria bacterium]|nr:hypothetical protein [Candidatus Peregrinibacteria bacterium]